MEEMKKEKQLVYNQLCRVKRKLDELRDKKELLMEEYNILKHHFMHLDKCLALVDGRCKIIENKPQHKEKKSLSPIAQIKESMSKMSEAQRLEFKNILLDLDEKLID